MVLSRSINRIGFMSIVAGVLYCSWPLGYWLNPRVAKVSLASGLEAINQPYNWLFIAGDMLGSIIMIIVCGLLWRKYRGNRHTKPLRVMLLCIVAFGVGTFTDALLPEHCVPNLMQCQSFTQDHYLLAHGIFSILASIFLFFALGIAWFYERQNRLLTTLLIGYMIFGIISLVHVFVPGNHGNWSENYFITLSSFWLIYVPHAVHRKSSL